MSPIRIVLVLIVTLTCFQVLCGRPAGETDVKHLSFSIIEDYDKGEDLRQVALDFELINDLHLYTWRGSLGWDNYEPEPGKYDFKWLHQFADLAAKNGITLRPYIAYTPKWAAKGGGDDQNLWNDPPAFPAQWRRFVLQLASEMHRHSNIKSYEIYNEENSKLWWDGTAREYNNVLAQSAEAIRSVDRGLQVLFGGMAWPDANWVDQACKVYRNANSFDVLPLHAYPETWTPADVQVENYLDSSYRDGFLKTVDAACGPKPIWINETGFATTPGKSELDQANWWARAFATFAASPRVEHIGIYEIKDPSESKTVIGDAPNHHLGLLRSDRTKKLAFHTVRTVVGLLDAKELTVADSELRVSAGSGEATRRLYYHLFVRPDGRQILFIWDKVEASTVRIVLARKASSAIEIALDGARNPYPAFRNNDLEDVRLKAGTVKI